MFSQCQDLSTNADSPTDSKIPENGSLFNKYFGPESNVASPTFKNRWLMVIPAFTTQMFLGAHYAWSLMADVCTREIGDRKSVV